MIIDSGIKVKDSESGYCTDVFIEQRMVLFTQTLSSLYIMLLLDMPLLYRMLKCKIHDLNQSPSDQCNNNF